MLRGDSIQLICQKPAIFKQVEFSPLGKQRIHVISIMLPWILTNRIQKELLSVDEEVHSPRDEWHWKFFPRAFYDQSFVEGRNGALPIPLHILDPILKRCLPKNFTTKTQKDSVKEVMWNVFAGSLLPFRTDVGWCIRNTMYSSFITKSPWVRKEKKPFHSNKKREVRIDRGEESPVKAKNI